MNNKKKGDERRAMKVKEETAGEKRGRVGDAGARFANWVLRGWC